MSQTPVGKYEYEVLCAVYIFNLPSCVLHEVHEYHTNTDNPQQGEQKDLRPHRECPGIFLFQFFRNPDRDMPFEIARADVCEVVLHLVDGDLEYCGDHHRVVYLSFLDEFVEIVVFTERMSCLPKLSML